MEAELVVKSQGGLFPHTHSLRIPRAAIDQPLAEGLLLTTSEEYSLVFKHKHEVRISRQELESVRAGHAVTVRDTDKGRHSFRIELESA
jgi:hypothetical protein